MKNLTYRFHAHALNYQLATTGLCDVYKVSATCWFWGFTFDIEGLVHDRCKGRGAKGVPKHNICLFQFSVLLNPCRKALAYAGILIRKLAARKALIPVILCHPQIVIEESSTAQELCIWAG